MSDNLDLTGGGDDDVEPSKKAGGRGGATGASRSRSGGTKQAERRTSIEESLTELADWIKEREQDTAEPDDLADVIRRDAKKIATVLTVLSEKHGLVAKLCDRAFGVGGPLSILRAFGPLGRRTLGPLLERRGGDELVDPTQPHVFISRNGTRICELCHGLDSDPLHVDVPAA